MTPADADAAAFVVPVATRFRRIAARAGRSLCAAILARATRRALNELPDDLLRDIGLARSDIPFVAGAVARGGGSPGSAALNRIHLTAAQDSAMAPAPRIT